MNRGERITTALGHFWLDRTVGEQRALAVLGGLLVLWGIQSLALTSREQTTRLSAELPTLRHDWERLQGLPPAPPSGPGTTTGNSPQALLAHLEAIPANAGAKPRLTQDATGVIAHWQGVPFAVLANWLDQAQRLPGVKLESAHWSRAHEPQTVDGEAVLEATR